MHSGAVGYEGQGHEQTRISSYSTVFHRFGLVVPISQKKTSMTPHLSTSCMNRITLQGTNISPKNGILKMIFLFPRWDMLIPWRVCWVFFRGHIDKSFGSPEVEGRFYSNHWRHHSNLLGWKTMAYHGNRAI